jgi:hypothetical protein
VAEVVLAQELPDVFGWVQLRRVGWLGQQCDVVWNVQSIAGLVPSSAIELHDGKAARLHKATDLCQVQVHCFDVHCGQNQGGANVSGRADGTEDVGPFITLVARRTGAASPLGPNVGQAALLADPGLVLHEGSPVKSVRDGASLYLAFIHCLGSGLSAPQRMLRHLTCGRVAQASRTIMPLARGSAPTRRDPPETRLPKTTKEEDGRAPRIAAGGCRRRQPCQIKSRLPGWP